jgi:NAD(P)-dependent dehydrogenase (short-subunit alcohol dehydrogenase family)
MSSQFEISDIPSQQGKTAIVTGASAGLGFETALTLAEKGATVILACRNAAKAETAKSQILQRHANAKLEIILVDLTELCSVRKFAEAFRARHKTLDLLINNAGIMVPPYAKTIDGFESQMAANYFGHFLLTSLLLDLMPDSPKSRVVSLASLAHRMGTGEINFEDLNCEQSYAKMAAYSQSKLACLMFALELQRRLKTSNKKILSVAAHPGASDTELSRYIPAPLAFILRYTLIPLISHSPACGALPTLMAAFSDQASTTKYFGPQGFRQMKGRPGKASISHYARREDQAAKLWTVSETLTGSQFFV